MIRLITAPPFASMLWLGVTACTVDESAFSGDTDSSSSNDLEEPAGESGDTRARPEATSECKETRQEAISGARPVDVIVAVDTSGTMNPLEDYVQDFVDALAVQLDLADIDYRLVLIADQSPDGPCVKSPVGSGNCPFDSNLPVYQHVVREVQEDGLNVILDTYDRWQPTMRPDAVKHVVLVSNDDSDSDAESFDTRFRALDPSHKEYSFHALVAHASPGAGNFVACWLGHYCCDGPITLAVSKGDIYLDLVERTGGVSGDVCIEEFPPIVGNIAESVDDDPSSCVYELPDPALGEFGPFEINVELSLDGQTEQPPFFESESDCEGDGWYYQPDFFDPESIRLCTSTCIRAQSATVQSLQVNFGCQTTVSKD